MKIGRAIFVTVGLMTGLFAWSSSAMADKAVFAGGCFWCMESDFEKLEPKGVIDVISGFTGGTAKNPTYYGDHTGHFESIEVTYDSSKISYKQLLDYYWRHIDPFDDKGQFCDKGHTYLSAIFVANEKERKLAEESKQRVETLFPGQKVATMILDASTFYPIKGKESFHQDFYKKSPIRYHYYRFTCGRDSRVHDIWGDRTTIY